MQGLYGELNNHTELMFLTLTGILSDIGNMFDTEFISVLRSSVEIHNEKFSKRKKKNSSVDTDGFFDEIADEHLKNHRSPEFSFDWVTNLERPRSSVGPT